MSAGGIAELASNPGVRAPPPLAQKCARGEVGSQKRRRGDLRLAMRFALKARDSMARTWLASHSVAYRMPGRTPQLP